MPMPTSRRLKNILTIAGTLQPGEPSITTPEEGLRPLTVVAADSVKHRKDLMKEHYSKVLNAPDTQAGAPLEPLVITICEEAEFSTDPISEDEVERAAKIMRSDAAAGPDGIPNRVLKLPELRPDLTEFLNASCCLGEDSNVMPAEMKHSVIISIPKKGNSTALENQRGISLMSTTAKTLNKVLLNRILPALDPHLLSCQSGFRPGRSTSEQIMTLRIIADVCRTRNKSATVVFVDFRKAFDTVSRNKLRLEDAWRPGQARKGHHGAL